MKTPPFIFHRVPWLLAALLTNLSAQVPEYTVVNLGDLGGGFSVATSINNRGQVVGASVDGNGRVRATLFSGTGTNNFDLGVADDSGTSFEGLLNWSVATSINDFGGIVGQSLGIGASGSLLELSGATYFTGNGSGNLLINAPVVALPASINNSGQVVGYYFNYDEIQLQVRELAARFSLTGQGTTQLGALGGTDGVALSQNHLGQIVGVGQTSNGDTHAALFSGGVGSNIDLGTLGGLSSIAYDINESGTIVGEAKTSSGVKHATLFSGTGSGNIDLGTLAGYSGSGAIAINNSGLIVGYTESSNDYRDGPGFLFSGGTMFNLEALVGTSASQQGFSRIGFGDTGGGAINDWGQIVGSGFDVSGTSHAILLNPVTPLSTVAPDGNTRNSKLVSGTSYAQLGTTGSGLTTATLLGGVAGSSGDGAFGANRDVEIQILTVGAPGTYGDVVELTGTESDTFVLSLAYIETDLVALFGIEENAALGWLNDSGVWVNAMEGNDGGTPSFVSGAWNASYALGTYGVDTDSNTVWAVLNHNSSFAIINSIPEPSALALSALATGLVLLRRRRSVC